MNGHSLEEASSDTEQSQIAEKVVEMKDGETKITVGKKGISRKMSNGESLDTNDECVTDKSDSKAIAAVSEINFSNDISDANEKTDNSGSIDPKGKNDDSAIDDLLDDLLELDKSDVIIENTKDKSDDIINNKKDKSDDIIIDTEKDKSEQVIDLVEEKKVDCVTNDVDSDTNSAKEIIEIPEGDTDKNVKTCSDSEQTSCKTIRRSKRSLKVGSKPKVDECIAETINDDGSDIEMIEESDPLAISDVDVKLAREQKQKKDSSLVILNTNTILKGSSSLTVTGVKTVPKRQSKVSANSTPIAPALTLGNTNVSAASLQSALQAMATASPGIQGIQTAYATALQQALLTQANNSVQNSPQYVNQLQQCYSSLGELQDEAYVIEAPSFIVPYVMEGKPKETIKDFLEKLKEEEEVEKAKKELEKSKEDNSKDKKSEEKNKDENKEDKDKADSDDEKQSQKGKDDSTDKKIDEDSDSVEEKEGKHQNDKKKTGKDEHKCDDKEKGDKKKCDDNEKDKMKHDDDDEDYKPENQVESDISDNEENSKKGDESKESSDKENNKSADEDDNEVIAISKDEKKDDLKHLGKWEPFYQSSLGKFFLDLGLNEVEEFIQSDIVRMTRRKLDKMKTNPTKQDVRSFKNLEYQLKRTREKNSHFNLELKSCRHCTFKTESELVMNKHLEAPHMINYTYRCNFCEFETRGPQAILFHMEAIHNVKGRLERAPAFFQCPLCPFEENSKSKMTRHTFACLKRYKPEKNCDLADWEPPAKIQKQQQRGRLAATGRSLESMKMSTIFPKAFPGMGMSPNMLPTGSLQMNAANCRGRGRPVGSYKNLLPFPKSPAGTIIYPSTGAARFLNSFSGANTAQQLSIANQVLQSVSQGSATRLSRVIPSTTSTVPNFGSSSSITIQSVNIKAGTTKLPQQPSISITPLVRGGQMGKNGSTSKDGSKPTFVICEICDGYIKDLEQLRNHMNSIHKVKIHPKMIYNRPPLNCQKCQQRFFTDQGLERHLLGTHGLVTSSMQEAANKGKDSGRCPICGKVFQWKLLNHVSKDHKLTLKPAHLSYKCTVCTATFNMYRLFENHVYSAHSVVTKSKGGDSSSKKSSGSNGPLKINDEITIIPQPSSQSKTDSAKSSKANDTPSVSKEITITKVGAGRSGKKGGVEVISLDESPAKRQLEEPKRRSAAKRTKLSH